MAIEGSLAFGGVEANEWEIISDDEDPEPPSKRKHRSLHGAKRPIDSIPSARESFGNGTECGDCINVRV